MLAGFHSAEGVIAEPVNLPFQTGTEEMDDVVKNKVAVAARAPELLKLLADLREKRAALTSVLERVQGMQINLEDGLSVSMSCQGSEFRWQQPDLYYGDVFEIISCANFRIGSDGQNWWWHYQTEALARGKTNGLVLCPASEMQEQNISFLDPFHLIEKLPEVVSGDLQLAYAGARNSNGPPLHLIERWNFQDIGTARPLVRKMQWAIDARTGQLTELAIFGADSVERTRYIYDKINEPLPRSLFSPPAEPGITSAPGCAGRRLHQPLH
ncbi:MAG TPA: hypothetical protein VGR78_07680 [Verrucomicrobiae bacterium]|nr:hypothetical protein [Verrucomicrobiae bacterium]